MRDIGERKVNRRLFQELLAFIKEKGMTILIEICLSVAAIGDLLLDTDGVIRHIY
jgi:hypothetical protein